MGRIKLYNHSRIADKPLYALLQAAAITAGVRGPVVIKIGRGGRKGDAYAQEAAYVESWFLAYRSHKKDGYLKDKLVATNHGYVVMSPRLSRQAWNPAKQRWIQVGSWNGVVSVDGQECTKIVDGLSVAEDLWTTALHEFAHIYEFQTGKCKWSQPGITSKRRPRWQDRPEEQRAMKAVKAANRVLDRKSQAKRRAKIDELKLTLAIHIEEVYNY